MKTITLYAALAGLSLIFSVPAGAAVPELINFQGKLTDSAGAAVTSSVPMAFKFYAAASGGSPVWAETQNVTPDSGGIYSVMLGIVTPFGIPFSNAYWLGVTVGTDSEMLPRYRVVSSAYSLYSLNSATAAYSVNSGTAAWAQGADWSSIINKTASGAASDGYLTSIDWNIFNGKLSASGNGSLLTGITAGQVDLGNVNNTSDANKPVSTLQQTALNLKANLAGAVFTGDISANNLAGNNTGDENAAGIKTKLGAAGIGSDGYLTAADWNVFSGKLSANGSGSALTGITAGQINLGNVNNTSDANKPVSTLQQTALNLKANLAGATFGGDIFANNLSGTNTGDQTTVSGNAGTVTNGVYTAGNQTIDGIKTFSSTIVGGISGNAATVTTNANLTGVVTSAGNATSIANSAITNAMLFNGAVANLSGTNTGDQINISGNAATVTTNANLTGVVTSVGNATSIANSAITNAMLFNGAVANLSGTNTGDQTTVSGNAGTVTNGVYLAGDQTIGGTKTFSSTIVGGISGNAATVTTNANLTGVVTSVGNATSIANSAITNAMLFNGAVANLSGTNTGDQTTVSGNAGTVTNGVYLAGDQTIGGTKTFSSTIVGGISGNAATVTTNADLTGVVTSVGNATSIANSAITNAMLFNGAVANLSGTNTGDQTAVSGNAGTVTNGVYLTGDQTIGGTKTFSSTIVGGISGNAATVTTNANLTGVVTSVGNATSIANSAITNAMLFNGAVANLSGTNTGDQTTVSGNAGTVTNGVYTTGSQTFTGLNAFISTITAKGYASASQHVDLIGAADLTTFAADGSGVVLLNQLIGDHPIATISGCDSGAVGQGQTITFVMAAYTTSGTLTFLDTTVGTSGADNLLLNGAVTWAPSANPASIGSTITLLCTTVVPVASPVKLWVEVAHTIAN